MNSIGGPRAWRALVRLVGTLLGAVLGLAAAEGRGETVDQETREVNDFHAAAIAIGGTVTLRRGDRTSVSIEAWPETLAAIETRVEAGELQVRMPSPPRRRGPIVVNIVYSQLDSLTLTGSAEVTTDAITAAGFETSIRGSAGLRMPGLRAQKVTVSVSGSGDLTVAGLEATAAAVTISGSGSATLTGRVDDVDIEVSGSGQVRGEDLATLHAVARVSGSGDVYVRAEETLQAEISGSGNIRYRGTASVESRITGSGRLRED